MDPAVRDFVLRTCNVRCERITFCAPIILKILTPPLRPTQFPKKKLSLGFHGGDPTFAPATIAPVMISPTTARVRVRVMIGIKGIV